METNGTDEMEKLKSARHDVKYSNVDGFRKDFSSRVWLTYREEFPALPGSTLTSDCGRGGTLWAGQNNLAQALLLHILSRDWTWSEALTLEPLDTETWTSSAARRLVATLEASILSLVQVNQQPLCAPQGGAEEADSYLQEAYHRTIMSWFGDGPSAQLGIHRLVQLGMTSGKCAGDWYGQQWWHTYSGRTGSHIDPQGLNSAAAPDGRASIILIPLRLSGEKINPGYLSVVKSILSLEYCIGIFSGKPKQAYFFVGFQDDSLIYMDPHYCQSFVDVSTSDFPLQILQPSSKEKYPPFTFMVGHGKDYELSIAVEKRKWPFTRDTRKAGKTSGDFVLL